MCLYRKPVLSPSKRCVGQERIYWRWEAVPFSLPLLQDMNLAKLDWWKLGGGVSNRQWNDILEIIKEKQAALDIAYLRQSAPMLGVADVLEKAFNDAGLQTP